MMLTFHSGSRASSSSYLFRWFHSIFSLAREVRFSSFAMPLNRVGATNSEFASNRNQILRTFNGKTGKKKMLMEI